MLSIITPPFLSLSLEKKLQTFMPHFKNFTAAFTNCRQFMNGKRQSYQCNQGPYVHHRSTTHRPSKVGYPGKVPGSVLYSKNNDRDGGGNGGK